MPFESRQERILLLMVTDVTERAQATAALRESQERYRAVVEALNEGLLIVGPDQRYDYCNNRLAAMLGYSPEELLGRTGPSSWPNRTWGRSRPAGPRASPAPRRATNCA